jgi:phage shock protein C
MDRHLYRSRDDRMIAGVAGGLAELWDADPSLVRILWALLVVLTGGIALIVYIVMAIVVPEEDEVASWSATRGTTGTDPAVVPSRAAPESTTPPGAPRQAEADWRQARREERASVRVARREARAARRAARGNQRSGGIVIGVLLVLLGTWFMVREYLPTIDWDWFWPLVLVGLGVLVMVLAIRPRSDGPDGGRGGGGS